MSSMSNVGRCTHKTTTGDRIQKLRAQLINCAMEYKDKEESPTKKLKTLIDQISQQDVIQTVQECVGRYPTIKLGTRKLVSKWVRSNVGRCTHKTTTGDIIQKNEGPVDELRHGI